MVGLYTSDSFTAVPVSAKWLFYVAFLPGDTSDGLTWLQDRTSFFHQETKIGKLLIQAWVSQVDRDTARLGSCPDAHMKTTGGRACDDGGSQ